MSRIKLESKEVYRTIRSARHLYCCFTVLLLFYCCLTAALLYLTIRPLVGILKVLLEDDRASLEGRQVQ